MGFWSAPSKAQAVDLEERASGTKRRWCVVAQCGQKNWCREDAPGVTSAMDGDFDSAMAVWAMEMGLHGAVLGLR